VDPRYFSAANVRNRLESYFQMVKAKRGAAGAGLSVPTGGPGPTVIPISPAH